MNTLKYVLIVIVLSGIVGWGIFWNSQYKMGPFVVKEVLTGNNTPVNNSPVTGTPIMPENPEGEADPSVMKLDMNSWHWVQTLYNDGKKVTPTKPEKFMITFKKDGTFSASTDCNGIGGNYAVGANKTIKFSNMMSTLMYCEGSQEGDFRNVLEDASVYSFTSRGELILDLKLDSGTATFR